SDTSNSPSSQPTNGSGGNSRGPSNAALAALAKKNAPKNQTGRGTPQQTAGSIPPTSSPSTPSQPAQPVQQLQSTQTAVNPPSAPPTSAPTSQPPPTAQPQPAPNGPAANTNAPASEPAKLHIDQRSVPLNASFVVMMDGKTLFQRK